MTKQNSVNANTSTPLSPANGGTGLDNGTNTITINAHSTIDQDVSSDADVSFSGVTVGTGGYLQGPTSGTWTINAYNTSLAIQTTLMSINAGNPPSWELGGAGFSGNIDNCELGFTTPAAGYFTNLFQGGNQITIGGSFTMSGAYSFVGTLTGNTSVIFPTSGTLATTTGGGFPWSSQSSSTTLVANSGFFCIGSGVVFTLPTTFAEGDMFAVSNTVSSNWTIAQNAGQTIYIGAQQTTTGVSGQLSSASSGDTVFLVGLVANTSLQAVGIVGNINYN